MKKSTAQRLAAKQARTQHEARIMTISAYTLGGILAICLLVLCANYFFQSEWWLQHATAAIVDGEHISITDYNFFFYRSYYEFLNTVGSDESGLYSLPQDGISLSEQYMDSSSTTTWQSYFDSRAETLLKETFSYYHLAQKADFVLSEEMLADIQYDYEEKIWFEAKELAGISETDYLTQNYGRGMTKDIYIKNLQILYTAKFYREYYKDSIVLAAEDLDNYYQAHAADYRSVFYQLFYVSGKIDGGMVAAKALSENLAQAETLTSFQAQCKNAAAYTPAESYWQTASVLRREACWTSISYLRDWLSKEHTYGDTIVTAASNGYYVAFFLAENDNNYKTANLKYFTVSGSSAQKNVESFQHSWAQSDHSVDAFFSLGNDIRDKDYSRADNHKLSSITYENETILSVPECALSWVFETPRESGDTTILKSDDVWYILYFDSYGDSAARMIADSKLRAEAYEEWTASVTQNISFQEGVFFRQTAAR